MLELLCLGMCAAAMLLLLLILFLYYRELECQRFHRKQWIFFKEQEFKKVLANE